MIGITCSVHHFHAGESASSGSFDLEMQYSYTHAADACNNMLVLACLAIVSIILCTLPQYTVLVIITLSLHESKLKECACMPACEVPTGAFKTNGRWVTI